MNTLVRLLSAVAALGAAFSFAGCANQTSRTSRVKVVEEFSVVESSTEKELTPAQVADLRKAVANYLREKGLTDGRSYYVRVTFPSADPAEEPQWAVVRISGEAAPTYTVIAAYPGRDDYYPYDFYPAGYSYGNYYPGYGSFAGWGIYDPFDYNYGYAHRPVPRDHGKADQPGKKPDHPPGAWTRWNNPPRDDGDESHTKADKPDPSGKKPDHSSGTWTRWNNTPHNDSEQPRDSTARTTNSDRWNRERTEARDVQTRSTPRPERAYTPPERTYTPPERNYTPAPERSYTPPSPPPSSDNSSRSEPAHTGQQQER
jgi:hypothetical protein